MLRFFFSFLSTYLAFFLIFDYRPKIKKNIKNTKDDSFSLLGYLDKNQTKNTKKTFYLI